MQKIINKVALPSFTRGEGIGALSIDLAIDNVTLKNSTIRVLSLVPADELLVLVVTPMLTTIGELEVTFDSIVSFKGASVYVSVLVVKSTLTLKGIVFPLTMVSVAVSVNALTVTMRVTFEEGSFVEVVSSPPLLSVTSCKAFFPVAVVVTTSFVSELAFAVVEVILEASLVEIPIILPALTLSIAFSIKELSFSNITVVVSHLAPTGLESILELTDVDLLVPTSLISIGTLSIENIVGHLTIIPVAFEFTSSVNESTLSVGFSINKFSFVPACGSLKSSSVRVFSDFSTDRFNTIVLEDNSIAFTIFNLETISLEKIISKLTFPNNTVCEGVGSLSIDFAFTNWTFKDSSIGVLSLVRAADCIILVLSPMFTTVLKLTVTINFFVSVKVTSEN